MTGEWTFEATADGITRVRLEVTLNRPAGTLEAAMAALAVIADIESEHPRPRPHGEPL